MNTNVPVVVVNGWYDDAAVAIARSLGRLGVPVYVLAQDGMRSPVWHSRFWRERFRTDFGDLGEDLLASMLDVGRTVGERHGTRPLLLTFSDRVAVFIERNGDALQERFVFPRAPEPVIGPLANKWEMHRLAQRLGIPTPRTINVIAPEDAQAVGELGAFPIVLKAADPFLPHKPTSRILASEQELAEAVEQERAHGPLNFILQEFVPGDAESVWMCNGYFGDDAAATVTYTGKKLRQVSSTGRASLAICLPNDTVAAQTRAFMQGIGYRGCVGIGWRYDERDGLYKVLDVNARVSGVFRLFAGTGEMDVVRACYRDLTGQPIPQTALRPGRKWMLEDDFFAALRSVRAHELTPAQWLSSMRGVRESMWFAHDDPLPFVLWIWNRTRLWARYSFPRLHRAR